MKRIVLVTLVLVLVVTVFSLSVYAQGPVGPPCSNPSDPDCDPATPFDGGILCVIAGALGFGIKKIVSGINKS
jgi:hypothetical protein